MLATADDERVGGAVYRSNNIVQGAGGLEPGDSTQPASVVCKVQAADS